VINIPMANTTSYASTGEETTNAWKRHGRATSRRMEGVTTGKSASQGFYADEPDPGK
jgi:photosystem II stability/assembly factor-like uncharacterized protein